METYVFAAAWICLGIVSLEDIRHKTVREEWIWCIAGMGMVRLWLSGGSYVKESLLGATLSILLFVLLLFCFPGAFGGGDVKLYGAAGLFLGPWGAVVGLAAAFLTAGSVLLLLPSIRKQREIPFVPFLSMGILVAYCFGEQVKSWYLS